MDRSIKVGQKVWLRPNPYYANFYPEKYYETKVIKVGKVYFEIEDPIIKTARKTKVKYRMDNLREQSKSMFYGEVMLSLDGFSQKDDVEEYIITIRKFFNSKAAYDLNIKQLKSIKQIIQSR